MIDLFGSGLMSLIAFLGVMSFVVIIHELGHYWAGRRFGVHAEAFSIGFGTQLFSWRDRLGTVWRVAALPLGGYVRFRGDENAASAPDRATLERLRAERSDADTVLHFKPLWQRAIVVAAGPAANFLLAIVLFSALGVVRGEVRVEPVIGQVEAGSPAEQAGIRTGDRVLTIDGRGVDNYLDLGAYASVRAGVPIDFTVDRGGETLELTVTPERRVRADGLGGERALGTMGFFSAPEAARERVGINPIMAPIYGVERTWETTSTIASFLGRLVTGRASIDHLNGPLGIATTAGQVANLAASGGGSASEPTPLLTRVATVATSLLALSALLSVSLGLMNLLPIPVLDGGHLVYYAYEAVAQRPPSAALQEVAFRAGFLMLIGVLVVATWNDLSYLRGLFS